MKCTDFWHVTVDNDLPVVQNLYAIGSILSLSFCHFHCILVGSFGPLILPTMGAGALIIYFPAATCARTCIYRIARITNTCSYTCARTCVYRIASSGTHAHAHASTVQLGQKHMRLHMRTHMHLPYSWGLTSLLLNTTAACEHVKGLSPIPGPLIGYFMCRQGSHVTVQHVSLLNRCQHHLQQGESDLRVGGCRGSYHQ